MHLLTLMDVRTQVMVSQINYDIIVVSRSVSLSRSMLEKMHKLVAELPFSANIHQTALDHNQ